MSADDWAELAQARKDAGECGTHGNKEPCTDCADYRRRARERRDRDGA